MARTTFLEGTPTTFNPQSASVVIASCFLAHSIVQIFCNIDYYILKTPSHARSYFAGRYERMSMKVPPEKLGPSNLVL